MSDPKVIYLGPACQKEGDGREWCEDDVWTECECGCSSVRYILESAAQSELAALREELEMARDDLVIFKGAISALGEAAKKLVVCARTTGGTAGPDKGLMDACAGVEGVITIGGIARAMTEFEQLTAERDDLAARLDQARDRKNSIVDLQQRLTAAEQRNAVMTKAIERITRPHDCGCVPCTGSCTSKYALEITLEEIREIAGAALQPTESGASE